MTDDLWNTPHIGIRLHDTVAGSLSERVKAARAQGFSCAHLALSKVIGPEMMAAEPLTPGLAHYVRNSMDGMDVTVLGCYLNLADPDEEAYQRSLKNYLAHLRFSRWMGAGMVGTETGNPNSEYRYDPSQSHTQKALELFMTRFEPVVKAAEKLGAIIAIEPVWSHIVWCPQAARRVLDTFASPNLGIILDPINLLNKENLPFRDAVLEEALELLGPDILTIHLKDYKLMPDGSGVHAAIGTGDMDYLPLFRYVKQHKPGIGMTVEDTTPQDAQAAREYLVREYEKA